MKFLKRKLKASFKSATMGVAVVFVLPLASWVQTHPDLVMKIIGQGWGGIAVAVGGVIVAIARMRSLGKDDKEA